MADLETNVYLMIGFCAGLFFFYQGFRFMRQKNMIENLPTSKIRSLAMGLVEIFGEVMPAKGKIIKSPFTQKDCVYYSYKVEEYRKEGKHSRWVTVGQGKDMTHFYLKDDTGVVLVDPKGAIVNIKMDGQYGSGTGHDPPVIIQNFLRSNMMSFEGLFGMNRKMRYSEYFIAPKDQLYILGSAGDNPFVEDATGKNNVDDIMIQKGRHEKFYYISDKSEKEIVKSFRWKIIGGMFGGGAISVACLAGLLISMGIM